MSDFYLRLELDEDSIAEIVDSVNESVDSGIDTLAEEIEWSWRRIASSSSDLKSTKGRYLDAIEVTREGDSIELRLNDELASAMESGSEPYSLKPGFLRGKQYRIIPLVDKGTNNVTRFRTITQGSSGWVHPGHKPRDIVGQVKEELDSTLLDEVMSEAFGRTKV